MNNVNGLLYGGLELWRIECSECARVNSTFEHGCRPSSSITQQLHPLHSLHPASSIILPSLSPSVLTSRGNPNTITRPPFDQSPKQQRVTSTPLPHLPQHVSGCHHTQSISSCLPVPSTSSSLLLIGAGLLNKRRCECTRPSVLALSNYKRAKADSTHSGWRLLCSLSSKAI